MERWDVRSGGMQPCRPAIKQAAAAGRQPGGGKRPAQSGGGAAAVCAEWMGRQPRVVRLQQHIAAIGTISCNQRDAR